MSTMTRTRVIMHFSSTLQMSHVQKRVFSMEVARLLDIILLDWNVCHVTCVHKAQSMCIMWSD